MESGIYKIKNNVNNKVYIGQSVDVRDRLWHHKSNLKHNRHENSHLQRAWNKYGGENFTFEVLEYCSEDVLDERERYYILAYHSIEEDYGYNKETGGSLHKHLSESLRNHMSEIMKGKFAGEKNPMYGKHSLMTEEGRKRMSSRMSGENNPMYGVHRKHTDEENKAASIRFSGAGNPFYGRKHTDEAKEKMRASKQRTPVRCVETGIEYQSVSEAQRKTNIHAGSIARASKKHLTAGGYHWEYVAQ